MVPALISMLILSLATSVPNRFVTSISLIMVSKGFITFAGYMDGMEGTAGIDLGEPHRCRRPDNY
jgi:hypothetical protein